MSNRECGEIVCHCNVKENAELIAKIMDYDVDGKVCTEVTEIVHCQDCKYKHRYFCACVKLDGLTMINPNDFCSKGERKDEE